MTEQPPHDETPPTAATNPVSEPAPVITDSVPTQSTSRWDRVRPRGRIGQVAGILVAIAAAIFIAGSIFVAGFALGSKGGDEHHGHGGDGYSQSDGEHHGDGDTQRDESGPDSPGQEGSGESDHHDGGDRPGGSGGGSGNHG